MSGIFSKPKMPAPPAPIEMPQSTRVDQMQVDRDRSDMMKRRRGRAATVLTGGSSDGAPAGAVATKALLGQ
jgi:hypothetical protein